MARVTTESVAEAFVLLAIFDGVLVGATIAQVVGCAKVDEPGAPPDAVNFFLAPRWCIPYRPN
jgi:hypothetical protein